MSTLTHARARRQSWWWLAVLVLGMLAPGISAALSHARGDFSPWQDICRTSTAVNALKPKPLEASLDVLAKGHCAACHLNAADHIAPPPAPQPLPLLAGLYFEAPERFWTAPVTAHAWRPAAARGPPAQA